MSDILIELQFYVSKINKIKRFIQTGTNNNIPKIDNLVDFLMKHDEESIKAIREQILKQLDIHTNKSKVIPDQLPVIDDNEEFLPKEITPIADENIKRIYKDAALKLHPDRPHGNKETFQELNRAYECGDVVKIVEIISTNHIQTEIPKSVVKMLKEEYLALKDKKRTLKNNWINLWDVEWTDRDKIFFFTTFKKI